jgi:putative peptidoglycan lipid II flippase
MMLISRIFDHESKTLESGALAVALIGVGGAALGVVRNALLASRFGASAELDAYFAAFRIPDFLYNVLIFGALTAGFMPVFAKTLLRGKEQAWEFLAITMNSFALLLGVLGIGVVVFAQPLAKLIAPGFGNEELSMLVSLVRIMMLQPILLALSNAITASLQNFKRFVITALSAAVYNLGPIAGVLWFSQLWGIEGLAIGVVAGAAVNFAIQLPTLYGLGFAWRGKMSAHAAEFKEMVVLALPRMANLLIAQVSVFAVTAIASSLRSGTLSIFTFANDLAGFPITLVGMPFATVAFPLLAQAWARRDIDEYRRIVAKTLKEILVWNIAVMLIAIAFREAVVRYTLVYGAFGVEAFRTTLWTFVVLMGAVPAHSALLLLLRAFFAMENTLIPLIAAGISVVVTVPTAFWFGQVFGAPGLALGTSLGVYAQAALLLVALKRRLAHLDGEAMWTATGRALLLGGITGLVGQAAWWVSGRFIPGDDFRSGMMRLITSAIPAAAALVGSAFLLGIRDIISLGKKDDAAGVPHP